MKNQKQKNHTIRATIQDIGLTIKVTNQLSGEIYQTFIDLITNNKELSEWFDSLEDLAIHLQKQQSYKINYTDRTLQILGKHPTKAGSFLNITKLNLIKKNNDQRNEVDQDIADILTKCSKKQTVLSNEDIKYMIRKLATKLNCSQNIKKQYQKGSDIKNNKKQQNERISMVKQQANSLQFRNSVNIQRLQQEIKHKDQVVSVIINKMKTYQMEVEKKIVKLQDRIQILQNKLTQGLDQIKVLMNSQKAVQFVDQASNNFSRLSMNGNTITKIRQNEADIFSKIKIKDRNSFTIRINTITQWMCVGVADSKLKLKETFVNQPNCVVIYSDGNFYNGQGMKGKIVKKFGAGDKINVTVNIPEGKIQWKVNQQLRLSYNYQPLKNKVIDWVPYIWILGDGDSISVID